MENIQKNVQDIGKSEIDSIMKNLQEKKVFSIKETIEDINAFILKRIEVNLDINGHVEKVKQMINNFILELNQNEPDQKLLLELRKKLIELEEVSIQEKLNFYRDTAQLKKELREIMQEYREKESSNSILDILQD